MKERIFYLDFIRVIAFILIIIFHFNISISAHLNTTFQILKNDYSNINLAHIGVPLFFIISGAALAQNYDEAMGIKSFYRKRIKSIFPLFYLAYIEVFLYYFIRYKTIHPFVVPQNKTTFLLTIIGMDGYTSSFCTNYYLIGEWFLGCIILMYIVFPPLYFFIKNHPFIGWIPAFVIYVILLFKYIFPTNPTQDFFMRLPEFIFGIYVGQYLKKVNIKYVLVSIVLLIILLFGPILNIAQIVKITIAGIASFIILLFVSKYIKNRVVIKVVRWLSVNSYAIYLLHHVISEQILTWFEGGRYSIIEIVVIFILTLCLDILAGYFLRLTLKNITNVTQALVK